MFIDRGGDSIKKGCETRLFIEEWDNDDNYWLAGYR